MSPKKKETNLPADEKYRDGTSTNGDQIQEALRGLRYGQVTIIVQDGKVVQIDRTERKRLV